MINHKKEQQQKREENVINAFILLENNTYESTQKAIDLYQLVTGMTNRSRCHRKLMEDYKHFNSPES